MCETILLKCEKLLMFGLNTSNVYILISTMLLDNFYEFQVDSTVDTIWPDI